MYRRYKGPPDGRSSVCMVEAILDNCLQRLVFCGLSCFPFGYPVHHFLKLSTVWKEIGVVEKEKGLPVFDVDIVNTFFFCTMLRLPSGSRVKSARIYPSWRG